MKNRLIVACVLFALLIAACATSKKNTTIKGETNIKDVRQSAAPGEDLIKYHHHDVDVFRTSDNGSAYRVYYYRKMDDTLQCFQAVWSEPADLDRAAYKWANDSLVAIRLYSSETKKEIRFKVFGNRRDGKKISGMMADN